MKRSFIICLVTKSVIEGSVSQFWSQNLSQRPLSVMFGYKMPHRGLCHLSLLKNFLIEAKIDSEITYRCLFQSRMDQKAVKEVSLYHDWLQVSSERVLSVKYRKKTPPRGLCLSFLVCNSLKEVSFDHFQYRNSSQRPLSVKFGLENFQRGLCLLCSVTKSLIEVSFSQVQQQNSAQRSLSVRFDFKILNKGL